MVKKISTLALAGLLALPAMASAGAGGAAGTSDIQAQVDALTKQLEQLKSEMAKVKAAPAPVAAATDQGDRISALEDRAENWDLASRFQWSGDMRNRADFHTADTAAYYKATDVATGITTFNAAYPAMSNIGSMFPTIGDMLTGLQPIMGSITTWRTNIAGMGITDQSQQDALYYMFTNPEVGAMLMSMAAMPTTAVTGAMATPETLAGFMRNLSPAARKAIFDNMGYGATPAATYDNDTLYTTRLRLNMRVKALENVEVKARIVGYKAWGMQDSATPELDLDGNHNTDSPYFLNSRSFDGTTGRQPIDNKLLLDRAYMNWNNIGGSPVWFSIGRRPTTDGPPNHLRMNSDERMATPVGYMDYPFDGISLGYAYNNLGTLTDAPGRIRFCYGRGFEAGPQVENTGLSDVDFAGFNWDVYSKGNRFFNIQSFGAFNIFNVPGDTYFPNPLEMAQESLVPGSTANQYLDRMNMGNIFQTAAVFMDKYKNLNYFVTGGWSHTDAKATDELGTSLLGDFWAPQDNKDGYSIFVGARYDITDLGLKIGAEYNHGTKNWLAFAPGHDDMYSSKLATRGNVYEVYGIYDIPGGEAVSKYGKAFIRLGYQHYDYNYTYSGMWLGTPNKIEDIQNDPLLAQFYAPIDSMDQVYLTFEATF
ncbi:MAG: DUF3373 domain-containing protein [Desulfobulbaceae bacterium]|nr:DUF3373 domain-containing protein [Desulfobulbaceae bacterium]HIJ89558.1 DUF3373 family protein [Deltaproteobacteria bacterium]